MLPNFLGVGFFRCGTSWLHEVLDSHPQVYVPQLVKEIHYFYPDKIGRGREWYEQFFPSGEEAQQYLAVGEVGPGYAVNGCLEVIAREESIGRVIFMIRNHADRIYSVYQQAAAAHLGSPLRFEDWLTEPESVARTFAYDRHLREWTERYGSERVLVIALEHVRSDPDGQLARLGDFLGVDPARFVLPERGKVNASGMPRFRRAYGLAARLNTWLHRRGLYGVSKWLTDRGLKRLFGFHDENKCPPLGADQRSNIEQLMEADTQAVESLTGLDLASWRKTARSIGSS